MIHLKGFETFLEKKQQKICSFYDNLKPSGNKESFFKNLTKEKKQQVLQEAGNILASCKKELMSWYKDPDTIAKFGDQKEFSDFVTLIPQMIYDLSDGEMKDYEDNPDIIKKKFSSHAREGLDNFINSLKCMVYFDKKQSTNPDPWGWYEYGGNYVYVNLYKFYSGGESGKQDLLNTIRHEMMHAIDYYLQSRGAKPYEKTHLDTKTKKEYDEIYNINDADQFARLQNFRSSFGLKPLENPKSIGDKLMKAYKSGRIKSDAWKFDLYSDAVNTYFVFIPKETNVVYTPQLLSNLLVNMTAGKFAREFGNQLQNKTSKDTTRVEKPQITNVGASKTKLDTLKNLTIKKNNLHDSNTMYDLLYYPTDYNSYKNAKLIKNKFQVDGGNDFNSLQLFSNFARFAVNEGDFLVFVNLNKLNQFNNMTVKSDDKEGVANKTA